MLGVKQVLVGMVMALGVGSAWSQQVQAPGVTKPLWTGAAPGAQGSEEIDTPTLTAYLPSSNPTKTAVVIAPGGGYAHLSMDKEGEAIARWMNARGVAGFVLKYRLGPKYHHPVEVGDAQRAIRTVRAQAEQYGIAADHIGMMGFSAGGHLASTAGTHFDEGNSAAADPIDRVGSRPDFLVLAYPVITMKPSLTHRGSHDNLLGPSPDPALEQLLSNELQVTARTPPTFLFSTSDDATVPVMNSVLFYSALHTANVPAELHIYEHGPHGVGLASGFPNLKAWPDALAKWMAAHGWMTADAASIVTTP